MESVDSEQREESRENRLTVNSGRVRTASTLLGILLGALAFFAASALDLGWQIPEIYGETTPGVSRLSATVIAITLTGSLVFIGWRWPTVGLSAGLAALILVVVVQTLGGGNVHGPNDQASFFMIVVRGGAGVLAPLVGSVLVCSSVTGLIPSPRR